MEDILWIIALILMSRILGIGKKGKSSQTRKSVQKPQSTKQGGQDQRKMSIEKYFKDMAQEIKKQQDILAQKAQEGYVEKTEVPAVTDKPAKAQVKKDEMVQRKGAYYSKDEDKAEHEKISYEAVEIENPFESLFESPQDIVKGIVYSEILSEPKGLGKN